MKRLMVLLLTGVVFLQGCAMATGKLIEEVSALEKPERFKPRRIDDIVKKYVSEGMSKEQVVQVLTAEGLKISEMEVKNVFPRCTDCESAISSGHTFGSLFSIFPAKHSLVIFIAFRQGKVKMIEGWYVTHVY